MININIIFVLLFVTTIADPVPVGGANCTQNLDCGGFEAGYCDNNVCVCSNRYANINCSYQRYSAALAGGLNIGLAFVCVGGVGNFVIGRNGPAIAQLILTLSVYLTIIPSCILICVLGLGNLKKSIMEKTRVLVSVIMCIIVLVFLFGFVWSIVDGAFMLQATIVDGNGYNLYTH